MADITYAQVWADHIISVGQPGETVTVTVLSGDTVYYGDPNVSASSNLGSLTVGQSGTMTNPVSWLRSASQSYVMIVGVAANTGIPLAIYLNAASYGAVGDGVTDDAAAIQSAINAASTAGGGTVWLPKGTFKLGTTLVPANNVNIYGSGPNSVLMPSGAISALTLIGDSTHYLTDCIFRDFVVDGANQTGGYNVATKGIQCPWARRILVQNLQVRNTIATGIAFDFPDQVVIRDCMTLNTGRLWTAGQAGGAGIGIGVSDVTSPDQTMLVEGCHCYASGSYGIFFESQDTFSSNLTPGIRVIGNYCSGAKTAGIGVSGGIGVLVQGNTCSNNGTAGSGTKTANITIDTGTLNRDSGENIIIDSNVCVDGKAHGIFITGSATPGLPRWCRISNNMVYLNGGTTAQDGHGIFLSGSGHALIGFSIDGNTVTQNKQGGIVFSGGSGHKNIRINDNIVFSNGQASGTTTDGIRIDAPAVGFSIQNNYCYAQSGVGNQVTGLNITATAVMDSGVIQGNNLYGNVTNSALNAGTLTNTTNAGNPPFN